MYYSITLLLVTTTTITLLEPSGGGSRNSFSGPPSVVLQWSSFFSLVIRYSCRLKSLSNARLADVTTETSTVCRPFYPCELPTGRRADCGAFIRARRKTAVATAVVIVRAPARRECVRVASRPRRRILSCCPREPCGRPCAGPRLSDTAGTFCSRRRSRPTVGGRRCSRLTRQGAISRRYVGVVQESRTVETVGGIGNQPRVAIPQEHQDSIVPYRLCFPSVCLVRR